MLTSAGLPEARQRAGEAGFAAFLSKPVKQSDLLDAIVSAFGAPAEAKRPPRRASPAPGARAAASLARAGGRRQPDQSEAGRRAARAQGHRVVVAPNGQRGRRAIGRAAFDLILMDVQMPEMGGLEATAAIRERERATGAHVPIVAMTAHAMTGDRERCLAAGMDGYVSKPLRPDELFAAIDAVLAPPTEPGTTLHAPPADTRASKTVDEAALLAGFGGNRRLLREVVDLFLADTPRILDEARAALARGDAAGLADPLTRSKARLACSPRRVRTTRRDASTWRLATGSWPAST